METPKQGNLFTAPEVDRLIAGFGRAPSEPVRQQTHEDLLKQKETFLALERIRHRRQQRENRHGHDHQRSRRGCGQDREG